ncbi:MAG TPA: hypothetical protein VF897_13510, partial [Roseiflexaceae bacterium]
MPRNRTSIEKQLTLAQVAINNALGDPSLYAALSAYGYNADRLQQGYALREKVRALHQRQKGEYGDLFRATDALEAAQRQAHDTYMRYVKVARVVLKNDRGAQQKLNLSAQRKRNLSGWLEQAQQFYTNALADSGILDSLAEFGITQALLEAGRRQMDVVGASDAQRRQCKGAAQDATRLRDEAVAALEAWMSDFMQIARVALQDRPQFLEKLGLAATAGRTAARAPTPIVTNVAPPTG